MKILFTLLLVFLLFSGKSQPIVPQKMDGSKFVFTCANVYFEVDAAKGARITSFKLNENELMYVDFSTTDMAGSTFWPSPQSVWGWPPAVNLDSRPYLATVSQDKIVLKGSPDGKSMLRFYKTISANRSDTSVMIDYCMKNEKSSAQKWAPWEITRVLNGGLTVFAKGEGNITGDMVGRTENISDYVWYDPDQTSGEAGSKFFCDGKGWLAHVTNGNMLFIKKFENIPYGKNAPGEAEIEVYTAGDKSYTELENQGIYASIASKDSVTWSVKWFARILPASIDVSLGSTSLISYIQDVLNREAPVTTVEISNVASSKIYPNPANKLLTIETGLTVSNPVTLRIIDLQGRIVLTHFLTKAKDELNIESLQPGIYIYDLKQGAETFSKGKIAIIF